MGLTAAEWIRRELERFGPVSFDRFMEWALYHPEHGYYASGRAAPGRDEGDFTTAPQMSCIFGRCLANWVIAADRALGEPTPFTIVEGGAGEGRLARDLLDALASKAPGLYDRVRYGLEDSGAIWQERQEVLLAPHAPRIADEGLSGFNGVYLSNELVDAFPVHRLRRRGPDLVEIFVGAEAGALVEIEGPVSSPTLNLELKADAIEVPEGCEVEVNLRAGDWLRSVAARLRRGFVLTIDYGDEADRLYGPHRPRGTCVSYSQHRLSDDLLARPGLQDLTAHVNFTALRRVGEEVGLKAAPLSGQRDFLFSWGLAEEVEALERSGLTQLELLEARRALAPVLFPGPGMGDSFHVLAQGKRVAPPAGRRDPFHP